MAAYLSWQQFIELTLEPNVSFGDATSCVAVSLAGAGGDIDVQVTGEVAAWCQRQPVPIVALDDGHARTAQFADVIVENEAGLERVVAAIDANPGASAILVQVLRASMQLPVSQALAVESLGYATLQGGDEFGQWLARQPARESKVRPGEPVVLVDREGEQLSITLNSPANRNALSVEMRNALSDAFILVAIDRSIEEVNVQGNGPCFSAGGDLSEFGTTKDVALAHETRMQRMPAQYLAPHAARYCFWLKGACVGAGIEIPAFAGRIVAAPDTRLRLPEVAMGLIPGAGGCVSIPRRVGRQRTALMAITGMEVDAKTALEWGLVDEIVG